MGHAACDVFVSYAREDRPRVAPLVEALVRAGKSVFWDHDIPPGKTWESSIGAALEDARCVIVVWTRHSIGSDWVHEEANEGKRRGVLLPVRLDDVIPPLGFRSIQAADLLASKLQAGDGAFELFLRAVNDFAVGATSSSTPGGEGRPTGTAGPSVARRSPDPPPWWKRWKLVLGGALALAIVAGYPTFRCLSLPTTVREALAAYKYSFGWSGGPKHGETISPLTMVTFSPDGRAMLHYARPGTIEASLERTALHGTWKDADGEGDLELQFDSDFSSAVGWWRYKGQDEKHPATMKRFQ